MKKYSITVMEKEISVILNDTGNGLNVAIFGGDCGHIGAISIKHPDSDIMTHEFHGHRDSVISEKWALTLSDKYNVPVVVSAGVHYENITKEGIQKVLSSLNELLEKI